MSIPNYKLRAYFDRYTYNVGFEHGTTSLCQAYNKCSDEKKRIWQDIKKDCVNNEGRFLSIISYNQKYFTAGYFFIKDKEFYFKLFLPSGTGILHLGSNDKIELKRQGMLDNSTGELYGY